MLRELFGLTRPETTASPQPKALLPASTRSETVIGKQARIEGSLKTEGNVRLEGTFVGDIVARGQVIITESGELKGDLIGETVRVEGLVHGDITARKVAVLRTGRVRGNLRIEALITEEGGFIQGLVTMEESVDLSTLLPPTGEKPEEKPEEATRAPVEKKAPARKTGQSTESKAEKVPVKAEK